MKRKQGGTRWRMIRRPQTVVWQTELDHPVDAIREELDPLPHIIHALQQMINEIKCWTSGFCRERPGADSS